MAESCLLYYITDRTAFPGDEPARRRRLLEKIAEAAHAGVDHIQLREKDLSIRELESLASEAVRAVRGAGKLAPDGRPVTTALLINSRSDLALAAGADGVHLRSDDISPEEVRQIWAGAEVCDAGTHAREKSAGKPVIGVSCHSPSEVSQAAANGASFAVFAPVFEKLISGKPVAGKEGAPSAGPAGLTLLQQACRANIPVLALGGVTLDNARSCLDAGASGIAAIRLFQENDVAEVVRYLRLNS
jgi:thiamine-phosphate pyrophosphorylase